MTRFTLWSRAAEAAARTPASRNRYVDFLRALSILAVISGHWLVAAPSVHGGEPNLGSMLQFQPWTRWLTWAFQVMPVFFFVGGYANGVSWNAAVRDGRAYAGWLGARLQRLIGPVLPLLVVWALLGLVAGGLGVDPVIVRAGSVMALIPLWFLAVYIMVVVLVPATYAAWKRFGMVSFWALAVAAMLDDALFFAADLRAVGWLNYAFVWLAVHQLGYAWRDGRLSGPRRALPWALGGMAVLIGLVTFGPHPLSMVSVPGADVSNSLPPKLPMLALGLWECGLALSLERPMRRWLARAAPWTATVLVNGMIMTIYLWHLTAAALVVGLALLLGGVGLGIEPGTAVWWAVHPGWMAAYLLALAPLLLLFGRFERSPAGGRPASAWRLVTGATLVCGGLAVLALRGIGTGGAGLAWKALSAPLLGAALAGVLPIGSPRMRTAVQTGPAAPD
ncbi:MAG: acyltransferase [Gemmatimonadota bacterium]